MNAPSILNERDYGAWLSELKGRIRARQMRAALAVNSELVLLYWEIGTSILEKQKQEGYGTKVIDRLANDLRSVFPEMKGFSPRNLKYMRAFAESWPESELVQGVLAQLSWYHHVALLDKLKDRVTRTWYAKAAIEYGWSRNILVMQIETRLYEREGRAITNFAQRLPAPQSDLATAILKDPYVFDFLGLDREAQERTIESALVDHIVRFLLELGAGFAFVGRQVHLEVGGDDFFIDLLFYHLKLRCYVVVELKTTPFKPEYTGQLNFYLSAVDGLLKHEHDQPTIGLLLCKSQNRIVAEYALKDIAKPIGVAEYQLIEALPKELETSLPSIERIEAELSQADEDHGSDSVLGRV
jgi:predicted nuclease of restriction endonuclease-like (RecB) superfamily